MQENELLNRIVIQPQVMTGKAVIRGTRLTVKYILKLLANSWGIEDIKREYPGIVEEDIQACLLFASVSLENTSFLPLEAA